MPLATRTDRALFVVGQRQVTLIHVVARRLLAFEVNLRDDCAPMLQEVQ